MRFLRSPRFALVHSVLLSTAVAFGGSFMLTGCPTGTGGDGDGDGDGDPGDGDGDGDGDNTECPAGGGSVCDVQNTNSPNAVAPGSLATLNGKVATTGVFNISENLDGFFISDDPPAFYGGVIVTVLAGSVTVNRGDTVDVVGTVKEFSGTEAAGTETQIEVDTAAGGSVTVTGTGTAEPIDVSDISRLNTEGAEGVLVRITDVFTSNPDAGGGRFEVQDAGGTTLRIGPSLYFYNTVNGEVFTSITGVVRYNTFGTGSFELSPRDAADVEAEGLTFPTKSIPEIRDSTLPGYVPECPFNMDCDTVQLANMVVVSPPFVIDTDNDTGDPYLFGFYIADPTAVNGNGELEPYSGTVVSIAPGSNAVRELSYTFGKVGDGPFVDPQFDDAANPADFPQIGDVVTVAGQNKPYFNMTQFADIVILRREGTLNENELPKPAQFTAANAGELKGGRPAYPAADYGPAAQDAVAASADAEKWEGVLVELSGVQTTDPCYPVPYNPNGGDAADSFLRDFGYWLVTGDVEVGVQFQGYMNPPFGGYWSGIPGTDPQRVCENRLTLKCADSRETDQTFTSLVGVVNFSFDVWRVNPRGTADIQPSDLFVVDTCGM